MTLSLHQNEWSIKYLHDLFSKLVFSFVTEAICNRGCNGVISALLPYDFTIRPFHFADLPRGKVITSSVRMSCSWFWSITMSYGLKTNSTGISICFPTLDSTDWQTSQHHQRNGDRVFLSCRRCTLRVEGWTPGLLSIVAVWGAKELGFTFSVRLSIHGPPWGNDSIIETWF